MTRDEAVTVVGMIAHGWPGADWGEERLAAYVEAILSLDAGLATAAVLRAQKVLRYRPSIAELREFIAVERRLAEPDDPSPRRPAQTQVRPAWTVRWARARLNRDYRSFPEQCEYAGLPQPFTDRSVWVQEDEYLEGVSSAPDAIVGLPDVGP